MNWFKMTIDTENKDAMAERFQDLWDRHYKLTLRHLHTNANDLDEFDEILSEAYIAYHSIFGDIDCIADVFTTEAKAKSKWVNEIFKQTRNYNRFGRDVSNKVKSDRALKYERELVKEAEENIFYNPEDEIVANLDEIF